MTEAEWMTCTDPMQMLNCPELKADARKLRLLLCGWCRRSWKDLKPGSRLGVETAERAADGAVSREDMRLAYRTSHSAHLSARGGIVARAANNATLHDRNLPSAVKFTVRFLQPGQSRWARRSAGAAGERVVVCQLLWDLFGSPFRPVLVEPAWRTPAVLALARAAYEERVEPEGSLAVDRLAVLADALEDAGCTDLALLEHLRGPGPHVRGCHVLDAILHKE
jgi:hypothetical protein